MNKFNKIIQFTPKKSDHSQYIKTRNKKVAEILGQILQISDIKSIDDIKEGIQTDTTFWFPNGPIPKSTGDKLGINSPNKLFGGSIDLLHSTKSIVHPLIPNASITPNNMISTNQFRKILNDNKLTLPGYTGFCIEDILKAFDILNKKGYIPRLKDPFESEGRKQYRLLDQQSLLDYLKSKRKDDIVKYGLILEANVIPNSNNKYVKTFSSGWLKIDGKDYCYVGEQFEERSLVDGKIYGTSIHLIKGDINELYNYLPDKFHEIIKQTIILQKAFKKLPEHYISRANMNFIKGLVEKSDKIHQQGVFFTEQTFRPGRATAAELLAIKELIKNPKKKIITATAQVHYGEEYKDLIHNKAYITYKGKVPTPFYERNQAQHWAYIHS